MRAGLIFFLVLICSVVFSVNSAFADDRAPSKDEINASLDSADALIDADKYDEAIRIIEEVLQESPSHSRGLKLYLRANKKKHEAERKAAEIRRKIEEQKAMKSVDDASTIPDKVYTDVPPVTVANRPTSQLSLEMQEQLNQKVSLNLIDADLSYILNLLFTTTGINIIADRDILADKRLDIHVENAKLVDLLDYISTNAGISYTVNDSGIWITTPVSPKLECRVFRLRYGITRTGTPLESEGLENTASSSSYNTTGNNNNSSTRNNRSYQPFPFRRFRKADSVDDNYVIEEVYDAKTGTISYAPGGFGGGGDDPFRSQMISNLSRLMRARDQQNNTTNNNNNGNNAAVNTSNSGRTGDDASDMEKLFEWMAGWTGSLQWPEGSNYRFDLKTNSIIVVSSREILDKVSALVDEFDVPPIQINISTRFVTVKVQDGFRWGIEGILQSALGQGGDGDSNRTQFDAGSGWNLSDGDSSGTGASLSFSGILTDPQYNIVMTALQDKLNGRLLSEPNVTTLSNEPARLVVAEEYPYPTDWEEVEATTTDDGATTTSTTGFVPTDFETENIGITLDVLPSVGTEIDTILLELHPQIVTHDPEKDATYNIISSNSDGGDTAFEVTRPTFARQEIIAKVVIRSGQTVVLGGLIDEEETEEVSKVPFLGDIPGLGNLFKKKVVSKSRSNLLIFVKAEIVDKSGRFYHPKDGEVGASGRDILPDILPSSSPANGEEKKPEPKPEAPKVEEKSTTSTTPSMGEAKKALNALRAQRTRPTIIVRKNQSPTIGKKK